MIFSIKFFIFKSVINRKEPEPQLVISAPAPGGNLISAPQFWAPAPQHWCQGPIVIISCQTLLTLLKGTVSLS
jgi:hypothetical protein